MGIQSTVSLTRDQAIDRIIEIEHVAFHKNYSTLEDITFEPDFSIEKFIEKINQRIFSMGNNEIDLTEYTNKMLEEIMDKPFYRYSMFDNYTIE